MCGNEDQKIFKEEESKEILNNIRFDDDDIRALESSRTCLLGLFSLLFCLSVCSSSQPIVLTLDSPVLHRLRYENYGFPWRFLLFSYLFL